MPATSWQAMRLSPGSEDQLWELFHENSKIGPHSQGLSEDEIVERMKDLHESLDFVGYPVVALPPASVRLKLYLAEAISTRVSARRLTPGPLTLKQIATLLHYAYGVTRDNRGTSYLRPFRVVPSGGALYPLEIFFHGVRIEGLGPGLYHYNPTKNQLRVLREGDQTSRISQAVAYPDLVVGASVLIFITAIFERSIFKYGDRGYRFILLEAGHVAQNINLVANALGLGATNVGGFFDRQTDDFVGLDGVTHSTIYMIAIGNKAKD